MPVKIKSLGEVVHEFPRSGRFFIGSGCAEPQLLVKQLAENADHFADVEIFHILTWGFPKYVHREYADQFRLNAFFIGPHVRKAVERGEADYTPIFLYEIPALFEKGQIPIAVALIQVSSPDAEGWCSYGISVDIVKSATEHAKLVIAEVNPNMPRTLGDSFIHISKIDYVIESNEPLLEFEQQEMDAVSDRIGHYVAQLTRDGDTIQTGFGSVPQAVLKHLMGKNDLGVHSEMVSDGIISLMEAGVITNQRKTLHPGKVITSFCMGTRRLYDYVDDNPAFEFRPSQYTNNPYIISQNDNMVSINSAMEVDLTGQVCADSLGPLFYSGIGGQADFIRGAARSRGGKPIIALPSTARNGTVSRIVPDLSQGAGVVTTRGDVHYVITEYGIAYLHGKSIRQRALELINIAHPDFRGELLSAMKARKYVYPDQKLETISCVYPEEWEVTRQFRDTPPIRFRPIKFTDERLLQDFFYSHTEETIYHRHFAPIKRMPHSRAQELVNVDYVKNMAVVGVLGGLENERIIAVARYTSSPTSEFPEAAFVVHEDFQGRGIGSFLLKYLATIAQKNSIKGFTAYVLPENSAMLRVFEKTGLPIKRTFVDGVFRVEFQFRENSEREA